MIEEHRPAFEYDWRTRFTQSLSVVGRSMTWGEALRLVSILRSDPSSAIAASLEGWKYPISQEALVLADLFDLDVKVHSDPKKTPAKPHPIRPFDTSGQDAKRYGNTGGRGRAEVISILDRARRGELAEGREFSA